MAPSRIVGFVSFANRQFWLAKCARQHRQPHSVSPYSVGSPDDAIGIRFTGPCLRQSREHWYGTVAAWEFLRCWRGANDYDYWIYLALQSGFEVASSNPYWEATCQIASGPAVPASLPSRRVSMATAKSEASLLKLAVS
jgi:hypothetical protein